MNTPLNSLVLKNYFFKIDTTIKKIRQYLQKKFDENNLDITVDQWTVLDHIQRYPESSQQELGFRTQKDAPTVTRIIDLLIKKELVIRTMSEFDRRKFCINLTDYGQRKHDVALPIVENVRQLGWQEISEEEGYLFIKILDKIYENISKATDTEQ
jgi:DNA-binding MarR family transcriptional regulator